MEKSSAGFLDRAARADGADVSAAAADQPLEENESATTNESSASDGEDSHKSCSSGSVNEKDRNNEGSDSIEAKKSTKDKIKGRDSILAECTYKDYSQVPPKLSTDQELAAKKHLPAKEPTFPVKLHMILSNPSLESIVSWLPHGRSWRILNQLEFEEKVIPLYFRHGRFSSFTRQVSGWGFHRITAGADFNSYYHELFLRGKPHLCHMMKRLTVKDTGKRRDFKKSCQVEPVPDFYLMDRTNPLPQNNPKDAPVLPGNALQSIGLPGHNPAAIMQQNAAQPTQQQQPMNEIDPLRLLQNAISGHINSSQAAVQQQLLPPPPLQQPLPTASSTTSDVMGLLSTLLSSGQMHPQILAAIIMALSSQAAPAPPQQQPYMQAQPLQQPSLHFVPAAVPAPTYNTYQQTPSTLQAPASVAPSQGNIYSNNSVTQLLSQLLQGQPQLAPQMPPPQQTTFTNPLASLFQQVKPVQQQQQQQQQPQRPPPQQPQSRENNTTGQTIANFLLEQQQQQAAAAAAIAAPPGPTSPNPLADLLQQAQSQPNGFQDLAAFLLSQQRNANGS